MGEPVSFFHKTRHAFLSSKLIFVFVFSSMMHTPRSLLETLYPHLNSYKILTLPKKWIWWFLIAAMQKMKETKEHSEELKDRGELIAVVLFLGWQKSGLLLWPAPFLRTNFQTAPRKLGSKDQDAHGQAPGGALPRTFFECAVSFWFKLESNHPGFSAYCTFFVFWQSLF